VSAANLVNTVPGVCAVRDVPFPPGRGRVDPIRPTFTLLEFG